MRTQQRNQKNIFYLLRNSLWLQKNSKQIRLLRGKMNQVTGDEIVALFVISESDDRMLYLFEKLGVNESEYGEGNKQ